MPSMKPLMVVMGVRSSWAMLPMNCPRGIVDGLQPRSHVIEGGRKISQLHAAVHRRTGRKVPAAQAARGLPLMSSIGPVMRLASTQHRMLHKIRMTAAEMPNIVSISVM